MGVVPESPRPSSPLPPSRGGEAGGRRGRSAIGWLAAAWAVLGMALTCGVVIFMFGYVFARGASTVTWEFLTQGPRGLVLGEEGGVFPAIVGSLLFTLVAVVLGGIPAVACAVFTSFYSRNRTVNVLVRLVVQCIAGIPSIVLGLFAYSFLVRDMGWGRCVLSSGVALAIMIMPFIEVRVEKAFSELPAGLVSSSYALGCDRLYTIRKVVLPACRAEIASALILGGCYAMGATAPLIFTGAVAFSGVPTNLMEPAMALPMHLYLLVAQGATSLDTAFGTAFVMMAVILLSNLAATLVARHSQERWHRS